jgi:hypothetical protein
MKLRRWRSLGPLLILVLGAVPSACGPAGVAEFQLYNQAFNSQFEQGDAILDSVARAERTVVLRGIRRVALVPDFKPEHAPYFVDTVDPPLTGSIRASLKSLKSYNDALGALASGEAAEVLTHRIGALAANVVGAVAASQAAFGGLAAIPAADTLASETAKALASAAPIIKQVATMASREAFRQQLVAAYPSMRELLLTLRNGTPAMFEILKRSRVVRTSLENASGIPAAGLADLEKERALLAAWVVLLDKTLVAMEAAVLAVTNGAPSAGLASLAEASIEMRVLAEQVKSLRSK